MRSGCGGLEIRRLHRADGVPIKVIARRLGSRRPRAQGSTGLEDYIGGAWQFQDELRRSPEPEILTLSAPYWGYPFHSNRDTTAASPLATGMRPLHGSLPLAPRRPRLLQRAAPSDSPADRRLGPRPLRATGRHRDHGVLVSGDTRDTLPSNFRQPQSAVTGDSNLCLPRRTVGPCEPPEPHACQLLGGAIDSLLTKLVVITCV